MKPKEGRKEEAEGRKGRRKEGAEGVEDEP